MDKATSDEKTVMNRRRFLSAGGKAMPVVLTLQSGAALARSSNLVSSAGYDATDEEGRTLCMEADSVMDSSAGGSSSAHEVYDLGEPAFGRVAAIPDRRYRTRPRWRAQRVSRATMCERGGVYYYRDRGWKEARIKHGMIVSATALSSFAGSVDVYEL